MIFGFKKSTMDERHDNPVILGKFERIYKVTENQDVIIQVQGAQYRQIDNKMILLDEEILNNLLDRMVKACSVNSTKYIPLPRKITIDLQDNSHTTEKEQSKGSEISTPNDAIFESCEPRWSFEEVYLSEMAKRQLELALSLIKCREQIMDSWGLSQTLHSERAIVLNFFGPSGTGKTISAEAVAKHFGKKLFRVDYSQLESKFVGETPKNIKACFQQAKQKDAVLVFDEADSFLGKRLTSVTQSADYGVNVTRSVMLMELEKHEGLVIFTTNLLANYDDAFKRRILANIEFSLPDENGRASIWKMKISPQIPIESELNPLFLAHRYNGVSGADISDILLYAAVNCWKRNAPKLSVQDFDVAYDLVQKRYENSNSSSNVFVKTERISEKQYDEECKNQL